MRLLTITDADTLRAIADDPSFQSAELYVSESNGHKFKAGDICILTGFEELAEYNGDSVEITAIRDDGPYGKAYYFKGRANEVFNWTYEYRLVLRSTDVRTSP